MIVPPTNGGASLDWGTLPSWLTLIGAGVAIKAYRRDARIRNEQADERRLVEVERIYVAVHDHFEEDPHRVMLVNDSKRTLYEVFVELHPRDLAEQRPDAAAPNMRVISFDSRRCASGSRHDLRNERLNVRTERQLDEVYIWTVHGTTADGYRVEIHSDRPPTAVHAYPKRDGEDDTNGPAASDIVF